MLTIVPPPRRSIIDQNKRLLPFNELFKKKRIALLKAAYYYLKNLNKYKKILARSGFKNITSLEELSKDFLTWSEKNGTSALIPLFTMFITDFGYGNLEQIPTIAIMKYIGAKPLIAIIFLTFGINMFGKWPRVFQQGYENLWYKISQNLHVILTAKVTKIERKNDRIYVIYHDQVISYDKLIIACPLDRVSEFLDVTAQEKNLFNKIKYVNYVVTVCEIDNMPNGIFYFGRVNTGYPLILSKLWQNPVCTVHSMSDGQGDLLLEERIKTESEKIFSAKFRKIIAQEKWDYFPHFDQKDITSGCYDQLENFQGKQNTYYVGSLLSFETVEHVVTYSKALVENYF